MVMMAVTMAMAVTVAMIMAVTYRRFPLAKHTWEAWRHLSTCRVQLSRARLSLRCDACLFVANPESGNRALGAAGSWSSCVSGAPDGSVFHYLIMGPSRLLRSVLRTCDSFTSFSMVA